MEFGERLKQARQAQHLTQATVAQALNVTRQTISSWETGHSYPDIDSLIRLIDYYHLSLDTLIKEDAGVTETLRKPEVLRRIRPITQLLLVINVCFIVAILFTQHLLIAKITLDVMGLLNLLAITRLREFTDAISDDSSISRWQRCRRWAYLITLLLTLMTIISWLTLAGPLADNLTILCGALWLAILLAEFSTRHERRTTKKRNAD
ncbi:helix-turn-helix domain-containing protein [Levilactobacillus namurensis]|uniref:helix-turn-helix domain-containing protein n=1 Tax=Levilactobacillus namurensis TaxID=380393 RepID=UPI00222EE87A|nr:helix-turn-helix transcriptional regulator [Levilactobacillus namurensis]MCW3778386.1 helix-turn-helix domain-containing protein [Levilactobacillus namurensis]MDT7019720.1 helix-turn-helix transcriptional regulator [Levilactobacillus namurensis]WNN65692.1 helix-turn-helix transcriptional regulator [Levilactobacillus namurensis]